MKKYLIENMGCDDITYAVLELTDEQYKFLQDVFEKINVNSSYGCQPTIHFSDTPVKEIDLSKYEDEYDYRDKTGDYNVLKLIDGKWYSIEW